MVTKEVVKSQYLAALDMLRPAIGQGRVGGPQIAAASVRRTSQVGCTWLTKRTLLEADG